MKDINLKDFFDLMKRRMWIIVVVTIVATLTGYFYSNHNNTPLYETSTRLILNPENESMSTLMVLIKDPIVMDKVKEDLQLSRSSGGIANQIEVKRLEDSQVIKISVTDTDSNVAAAIANTTASAFKSKIATILDFHEVQLLSAAEENPNPINGNQNRTVIIAFVFGLVTGLGLVFLLDSLDEKIRKERELEDILGVPVIGVISNMNKKKLVAKKRKHAEIELRGETVGIK